jgi:hypothetical protein
MVAFGERADNRSLHAGAIAVRNKPRGNFASISVNSTTPFSPALWCPSTPVRGVRLIEFDRWKIATSEPGQTSARS